MVLFGACGQLTTGPENPPPPPPPPPRSTDSLGAHHSTMQQACPVLKFLVSDGLQHRRPFAALHLNRSHTVFCCKTSYFQIKRMIEIPSSSVRARLLASPLHTHTHTHTMPCRHYRTAAILLWWRWLLNFAWPATNHLSGGGGGVVVVTIFCSVPRHLRAIKCKSPGSTQADLPRKVEGRLLSALNT